MANKLSLDLRGQIIQFVGNPHLFAPIDRSWRDAVDQKLYLHLFQMCMREQALEPYVTQAKQAHGESAPKCFRAIFQQITAEGKEVLSDRELDTYKLHPPYIEILTSRAHLCVNRVMHAMSRFYATVRFQIPSTPTLTPITSRDLAEDRSRMTNASRTFQALDLGSIQFLDLGNQSIYVCPSEIGFCKSLQRLDMSFNHLRTLPDAFGLLSQLTNLNLSNNEFRAFPPPILHLARLNQLLFRRNQLEHVPDEIARLPLSVLDVGENELTSLPECVQRISTHFYGGNLLTKGFRPTPPPLRIGDVVHEQKAHPLPPSQPPAPTVPTAPAQLSTDSTPTSHAAPSSLSSAFEGCLHFLSSCCNLIQQAGQALLRCINQLRQLF